MLLLMLILTLMMPLTMWVVEVGSGSDVGYSLKAGGYAANGDEGGD